MDDMPTAVHGTTCKIVGELRNSSSGEYVLARFFFANPGNTFQLAGELRMQVGEWQIFGAALSMGTKLARRHLHLVIDDPLSRKKETNAR